jgi:hypothetical protein
MFRHIDFLGKAYTAIMSLYFTISGLNALLDIDTKLARIGLVAEDIDGKVAFILIYCSLMIGIGIAIGLLYFLSKTWIYSAILAVTIVCSFISFRLVGALMLGELSSMQVSFIAVEVVEAAIGLVLIIKSKHIKGN